MDIKNSNFNDTLPPWAAQLLGNQAKKHSVSEAERAANQRKLMSWFEQLSHLKITEVVDIANLYPRGLQGEDSLEMLKIFLSGRKLEIFTYPTLVGQNLTAMMSSVKSLQDHFFRAEKDNRIKRIVTGYLESLIARLEFVTAVREKDEEKSFLAARKAYGDISPQLVAYEKLQLAKLAEDNRPSPALAEVWSKVMKPEEIRNAFLWCLRLMQIPLRMKKDYPKREGWFVTVNTDRNTCVNSMERCILVGKTTKKLDDVLALLNHEIGVHVTTIENTWDAGLKGFVLGNEEAYISVQEGLATWWEGVGMGEIFSGKHNPHWPFYVLAMECAREKNADVSKIYWDTFYRMLEYHRKLNKSGEENALGKKWQNDEELVRETQEKSWKITCRIRRGSQPHWRGWYIAKDKCYDEGCMLMNILAPYELHHQLVMLRIDPDAILDTTELGIIPAHPRRVVNIAKQWWEGVGKKLYLK